MVGVSRTAHFAAGAGMVAPHLAEGAFNYAAQHGMARAPMNFSAMYAHPAVTGAVAKAYNALPDYDERAVPAFHAMAHETEQQFDYLTRSRRRGGMGLNVEVTQHDPYAGPSEMWHDVRENNRLRVLSTATTGAHPIFSNMQNDQFRAVHDAFGHLATGRGVDRHGEEAAFQSHSSMFSPLARRALASETRGQNSAMITAGGQFQPQKVALLPAQLSQPVVPMVGRRAAAQARGAVLQARQFHSQAFDGAALL